ncbi:TVP38/TMEM64 family protein [Sedimentibacter sp. MB31-C6]|uniref:TVP38/TMEM64 family protein n=1 Tax=Sedimentibacter sp. MB31-C6 TaxID=3109366 RepID=UPI002DDDA4A7|nr:VTT domain-containing protein [Sedimentibacter sp. MB36-C1]WSI04723.1 VTT domain-containing protein [Sedimentibacter sp. MB36-C1]
MDYMDFTDFTNLILKYVEQGGPLLGIAFPIIEAFLPFLPLVAFVIINVSVFGFFAGYIYSWIGNCLGSFFLFLFLRKVGGKRIEKRINKSKYKGTLEKIKRKNFTVLFFFYCFPFTPSFLISGAAALTNMSTRLFLITLLPGKFVMLLSLAFIGQNVRSFFYNPIKSITFIIIIIIINVISKFVLEKYEKYHRNS